MALWVWLLLPGLGAEAWRVARPWTEQAWCPSVVEPEFPFAYEKYPGQRWERKGRSNPDTQDDRHTCAAYGIESKCHRCERIACGEELAEECEYQLQGVNSSELSVNVGTASDGPWAVAGRHRHDFGNASLVCVLLKGGNCTSPLAEDLAGCPARCWGFESGGAGPAPKAHLEATRGDVAGVDNEDSYRTIDGDSLVATDVWEYQKRPEAQGSVITIAGGVKGFADGASGKFDGPSAVALDAERNIYVVDTNNHAVRFVDRATGVVSTIAGAAPPDHAEAGDRDGSASLARFSKPRGLALTYEPYASWGDPAALVLYVADTGNHRIRKIIGAALGRAQATVATHAATTKPAPPEPGFADGRGSWARFDAPRGLAVHHPSGDVVVADTNNHLIRLVNATGFVSTLAGHVEPLDASKRPTPGCTAPCVGGVMGVRDGNSSFAEFEYPKAVAVDVVASANTWTTGVYTVVVADGLRVRRVIPAAGFSHSTYEFDGGLLTVGGRVVTLAGTLDAGVRDGPGAEATFERPAGVVVGADGHAYVADASSCRIRRVSPPRLASADLEADLGDAAAACAARLVDVVRPDGCASYEAAVGARDLKVSARAGHVHYNYAERFRVDREPGTGKFAEDDGPEAYGRSMKNCVGSPPPDRLDKRAWPTGLNLVVDDEVYARNDDTGRGTTLHLKCPASCSFYSGAAAVVAAPGGFYSDSSPICAAALHAGVGAAHAPFFVTVQLIQGAVAEGFTAEAFASGLNDAPNSSAFATEFRGTSFVERMFTVRAFPETDLYEVQSIAGRPAAPLDQPCGFEDAFPPQEAAFDEPVGLALYYDKKAGTNESLVIADFGNHRIRALAASCSQPCENGGRCVGAETCACAAGWVGHDCTRAVCTGAARLVGYGGFGLPDASTVACAAVPKRAVCVAPETCACAPGWAGPDCGEALCVQACAHGGDCVAPDTCACPHGWFDTNCTTPVCAQTCGNGGNCTAPDRCTCPDDWTGPDCREPVCQQDCFNGGSCVAPDTCQCPPQWHGYDCGLPVCMQGVFTPFDRAYLPEDSKLPRAVDDVLVKNHLPQRRTPTWWPTYLPCDYETVWCNATNEFDCVQPGRTRVALEVPSRGAFRRSTGRNARPNVCDVLEVREDAKTYFAYDRADNSTTRPARYTPLTPYGWRARGHPWRAFRGPADGGQSRTRPWGLRDDRQVAHVSWRNVTQGRYACANGGTCEAPDVCSCAAGWSGFDCRTPVCAQGYYRDFQAAFVSGTEKAREVDSFEHFMDPNMSAYRLGWPYSNPDFVLVEESFQTYDNITRAFTTHSGARYLAHETLINSTLLRFGQGGYRCSVRTRTAWEGPGRVFDHVNFFSRYMDTRVQGDGFVYANWSNMDWPPTHAKTKKLELTHALPSGVTTYVYTNEGHRRDGIWEATGEAWTEGTCITEFRRVCGVDFASYDETDDLALPLVVVSSEKDDGGALAEFGWQRAASDDGRGKAVAFVEAPRFPGDVSSKRLVDVDVQDTDFAYRPRIRYDDFRASGAGRWAAEGGECVDTVLRGCFNNGTCVAPDVCACAAGWDGLDCSLPVCAQPCLHHGNCTMPETCTCERGWSGSDCGIPVCAQECHNGGRCVAPDTCQCHQYASDWPTAHAIPRPVYRKPGVAKEPQMTGWTGFDCSVPICVQAEKFTLNVGPAQAIRDEMQRNVLVSVGATNYPPLGYRELGGRGFDGREDILDPETGKLTLKCDTKPRCPSYDNMVVANVGESFPKACGYDVLETGCCVRDTATITNAAMVAEIVADPETAHREWGTYDCFICEGANRVELPNNFTCAGAAMTGVAEDAVPVETYVYEDVPEEFFHGRLPTYQIRICGVTDKHKNFEEVLTRRPEYAFPDARAATEAESTNLTSFMFLCGVTEWVQGDYIDDAGLGSQITAVGIDYGPDGPVATFPFKRHVRVNTPNIIHTLGTDSSGFDETWTYGEVIPGEGVYECAHEGTCISPDVCTCKDGWAGDDCSTSSCRHLQGPSLTIAGCENGGICRGKDDCACIQTPSVLKKKYPAANGGVTGWTGSDCTLPMCVQGYFDPFCTDLAQAPGGEGCYRCANGGNCTAPDVCTCAAGWQGYDCRTPKCEVIANPLQRRQLDTDDEAVVDRFERNPCSLVDVRPPIEWKGYLAVYGNCTAPNECNCMCKHGYDDDICRHKVDDRGKATMIYPCRGPFQDMLGSPLTKRLDLVNYRNLLGVKDMFGTRGCRMGYEGSVSETYDRFVSCHMRIYQPTRWEAHTLTIIICTSLSTILGALLYYFIRKRMKEKFRLAKIERRRSRRSSEDGDRFYPKRGN